MVKTVKTANLISIYIKKQNLLNLQCVYITEIKACFHMLVHSVKDLS